MDMSLVKPRDFALVRFFNAVYAWMAVGLAVTGTIAYAVSASHLAPVFSNGWVLWPLCIAELLLVMAISGASRSQVMSASTATVLFLIYAALNGLTLSVIFALYTKGSIVSTFFITAGTFAGCSVFGMVTKKDMSSWGGVLLMLLVGLIVAMVVNIFIASSAFQWLISIAGVVIFVLLTAYDTQKLKVMAQRYEGSGQLGALAINGSLTLYLDFLNLFLFLLDLVGVKVKK